jgi:acetylornithine deacetylase/succinyl-diaminopimelate desuccinylase-like protein
MKTLYDQAILLLEKLIRIPSFSGEERAAADCVDSFLAERSVTVFHTAEEENSGPFGIKCILDELMPISFAIVGEPTGMQMAVAEKGFMVLHPLVKVDIAIGRQAYHYPNSSDQGWLNAPSLKMGPGNSARSHTADEFIYLNEISDGIGIYTNLLESIFPYLANDPRPYLEANES